jgi:hypothetical protein
MNPIESGSMDHPIDTLTWRRTSLLVSRET